MIVLPLQDGMLSPDWLPLQVNAPSSIGGCYCKIISPTIMLFCVQASSVPIFGGVLIGYLMYDMQHYAIHYGSKAMWLLPHARQNHLDHHYKSPAHGFGISSGLVDFLLATLPAKAVSQRPALAS